MAGILVVPLAFVSASLLVLYFDWRRRLMRRIRAEDDVQEDLDEAIITQST
jgi:hypothetical protein